MANCSLRRFRRYQGRHRLRFSKPLSLRCGSVRRYSESWFQTYSDSWFGPTRQTHDPQRLVPHRLWNRKNARAHAKEEEKLVVRDDGAANRRGDVIAMKRSVARRRPRQRILGIHRLVVEIVADQAVEGIGAGLRCECRL